MKEILFIAAAVLLSGCGSSTSSFNAPDGLPIKK